MRRPTVLENFRIVTKLTHINETTQKLINEFIEKFNDHGQEGHFEVQYLTSLTGAELRFHFFWDHIE